MDGSGSSYFDDDEKLPKRINTLSDWATFFDIQEWRLEDHVAIYVHRAGEPRQKDFAALSAGQQRSVLLSLTLCGKGRRTVDSRPT